MIRNLKVLGLMAVAALAMSAMFASAAQAQSGTFTAGVTMSNHQSIDIHGEQYGGEANNFLQAGSAKVVCEDSKVTFTASDNDGTAVELTITPHYTHCKVNGLAATVTMNGCRYNLDRPVTIAGTKNYTGTVDLLCDPGKTVEIHAYIFGGVTSHSVQVCKSGLTPFTNRGHIVYTPGVKNGKDDLTLDVHVTKIPYHQSGSCGSESGEGTYVSQVTLTASQLGAPKDLWIGD